MRILVIEDDPDGRAVLVQGLAESGQEATSAPDFTEGLALAMSGGFDALIIDRGLPGGDGIDIVTALWAQKIMTPVIFLTALNEVDDRIAGLRAGGDDYIAKPFFSFLELLARLEAILRRKEAVPDTILRAGELEMNLLTRTVKRANVEIVLQPREYALRCLRGLPRVDIRPAIFREHGMEVATVGPDDKVVLKPVTLGRNLGTQFEVLKGLTLSDRVINSLPSETGRITRQYENSHHRG